VDDGVGATLRLGREFAGFLSLTPELGISYHSATGVHDASIYRGFIGPRLSVGRAIQAGIFGHLGYGRIDFRDAMKPDPSHDALAYDAGMTLDFTLIPRLDVGAHAAYNGARVEPRTRRCPLVQRRRGRFVSVHGSLERAHSTPLPS
jgi:hypothetical protein